MGGFYFMSKKKLAEKAYKKGEITRKQYLIIMHHILKKEKGELV
jgi:hypothetical protein